MTHLFLSQILEKSNQIEEFNSLKNNEDSIKKLIFLPLRGVNGPICRVFFSVIGKKNAVNWKR